MKKYLFIVVLALLMVFLSSLFDKDDFSDMNELAVSRLYESPAAVQVFNLGSDEAVEA